VKNIAQVYPCQLHLEQPAILGCLPVKLTRISGKYIMTTKHLQAIEFISQDNWQAAHELVQHEHDELAFMIHGYLHREQGDLSNANYWYNRAGKTQPNNTPEQELERLYQLAKSGLN
jgi:hypothetical protein